MSDIKLNTICKYFLLVRKLFLHFVCGFFCCAKVFTFNQAPFIFAFVYLMKFRFFVLDQLEYYKFYQFMCLF